MDELQKIVDAWIRQTVAEKQQASEQKEVVYYGA